MYKVIALFSLLLFTNGSIFSQTNDDNIIITNKQATYEYKLDGDKTIIKEKSETEYEASKMSGYINVYEMYDNESSIDKVKIKGIKGVQPQYRLYSSNDIFYTDAKICYFRLDFQEKGKVGKVEFEKTFKNPRYFTRILLAEPEYVKTKTVKIVVPAWMKAEFVEYNLGSNIKKEILTNQKDNTHTYVYTIENQEAMADEPMMQGTSFIYPHILILNKQSNINGIKTSYFETLSDQYNWYKQIVNDVNNDKNIISNKAKEITRNSKTDLDKIKDIYAWVQSNIRYVAFEDGIAGFKPDDAQEVMRKKFGDCKGMANLVKSLLEAEGFDARLSWLGTNHIIYDYSTPSLSVDNHMICALLYNGKTYYLDPTYEYMPLGKYPQSIQGRQVMIENKEEFILDRIPVFPAEMNTDSLYCKFMINDGKMTGQAVRYFMGESKERILSLIHATPKDKIDEALKYFAQNGNIQDKATNLRLEDATSKTEVTYLAYDIENNSGIQQLDKELYIDMNPIKDFINRSIDIQKRKTNLLLPYLYRIVREIDLIIPQNYTLTHTPENFTIDRNKYLFKISYIKKANKLTCRCELMIKDPLIEKSSFEQWNADITQLKKNYQEQIVLTIQ